MKARRIFFILFLIILALRLSLSVIIEDDEEIAIRPDSDGYIMLASNIVDHGQYHMGGDSRLDLYRTPGYPTFLALIFWAFGKKLWLVALIQLAISSLTAWMVYRMGMRWFSPSTGLVGGIVLGVLPNTAAWSLVVLSETLFALLLVVAVFFMVDFSELPKARTAFLCSAFLGTAILVRPIGLVLVPVWVGVLLWYSPGGMRAWTKSKYALVFIGGVMALLLPWMVRNEIVWDTFSLSTINKWNLDYYIAPAILAEEEGISLEEARDRISVLAPPNSEDAAPSIEIILRNPLVTAKVWLTSLTETLIGYGRTNLSTFWGQPYNTGEAFDLLRQGKVGEWLESLSKPAQLKALLIMVLLVGIPVTVLIFAVAGWRAAWRAGEQEKKAAIICLATILALLLPVIGVGNARFRVPIDPFLVLMGAWGLTYFVEKTYLHEKNFNS